MPYYMKGITGLVACALIKNLEINKFNTREKNAMYLCIYKRMKYHFSDEIRTYLLPNETRYDMLTNCFYKAFMGNNNQYELAGVNFENDAVSMKLI